VTRRWLRITARSPSDELAGLLAEGLLASGGSAVEESGDDVISWIPLTDGDDAASAGTRVRAALREAVGQEPARFDAEEVAEQDWLALWRAGLEPRYIGERIIVAPTWSEVEAADEKIVIRIDPQMAFGTGEHASTRGVLRLMQQAVRPGDRVIDVGAGSAILAIAAVRLGASSGLAVESDPDAMENAGENVDRNGVAASVELRCELVDDAFLAARGCGAFDGILANVLSSVLMPLLPAFQSSVAKDGWAILSGILLEEAPEMRAAAGTAGFSLEAEDAEGEWWSVLLRKSSS
jgi:ribosomal protein L11 methyltransferase